MPDLRSLCFVFNLSSRDVVWGRGVDGECFDSLIYIFLK